MRLGFALLPADASRIRTSDSRSKPPLRHAFTYKNADFGYPRCWVRQEVLEGDAAAMYLNGNGESRRFWLVVGYLVLVLQVG